MECMKLHSCMQRPLKQNFPTSLDQQRSLQSELKKNLFVPIHFLVSRAFLSKQSDNKKRENSREKKRVCEKKVIEKNQIKNFSCSKKCKTIMENPYYSFYQLRRYTVTRANRLEEHGPRFVNKELRQCVHWKKEVWQSSWFVIKQRPRNQKNIFLHTNIHEHTHCSRSLSLSSSLSHSHFPLLLSLSERTKKRRRGKKGLRRALFFSGGRMEAAVVNNIFCFWVW